MGLSARLKDTVWCGNEWLSAHAPMGGHPTGFAVLDAQLPGRGWPMQGLVEVGVPEGFHCEWRLLQPALQSMLHAGSHLYLVTPPAVFQAMACCVAGPARPSIVWLHAQRLVDALWLVEQVLQAQVQGAVMVWIPHLRSDQVRRLHTKAVAGGVPVFWFRPAVAGSPDIPSPVPLRLWVEPSGPWHLAVRILKRRAHPCEQTLRLPALPADIQSAASVPRGQVGVAAAEREKAKEVLNDRLLGRASDRLHERLYPLS